jgi:hypothetical protein
MSKRKQNNTLRRSQLISPFGVGSLLTQEDGTSVIICGLDFWLPKDLEDRSALEIVDVRLKERLRVSKLYRPPTISDESEGFEFGPGKKKNHPIPVLRFPTFYSCKSCNKLSSRSQNYRGKVECSHSSADGKSFNQEMFQVPYVIMCEEGHLNDFPWRQWVHRTLNPDCDGDLFLRAATAGNLQNSIVACAKCSKFRSMANAMSKTLDRSNLTMFLADDGTQFLCNGLKPWLGERPGESKHCGKEVRAAFRGAGNVYFPNVESSILIPDSSKKIEDLCSELSKMTYIHPRHKFEVDPEEAISSVRYITKMLCSEGAIPNWLEGNYSDDEIRHALSIVTGGIAQVAKSISVEEESLGSTRIEFLNKEFLKLQIPSNDDRLSIQIESMPYGSVVADLVDKVHLVTSLTETRAFWGFSRVEPSYEKSYFNARKMLRRYKSKPGGENDWLPAIQVKGEGLFLKFNDDLLQKWANQEKVVKRFESTFSRNDSYFKQNLNRTPEYVLLHTISHLLIKELTFFCGYGQAALQERLYVSNEAKTKMSGILIYTASGDSEGTLGGLVRMGKPGYLEEVVTKALEKASWCSNDPVCSESGHLDETSGVSPASCYACTLLPETSCENFNNHLDRGLVVGTPGNPSVSYIDFKTL